MSKTQIMFDISPLAVLCVDDEKMVLDNLIQQLESGISRPIRCEAAESAAEALEVAQELCQEGVRLLVVISDFWMPEMNGGELLKQLAREFPKTRLLLLTGQADQDAVAQLESLPSYMGTLRKPWDAASLVQLVQRTLDELESQPPA
jgi:DNA-binding NtrC family response regulator